MNDLRQQLRRLQAIIDDSVQAKRQVVLKGVKPGMKIKHRLGPETWTVQRIRAGRVWAKCDNRPTTSRSVDFKPDDIVDVLPDDDLSGSEKARQTIGGERQPLPAPSPHPHPAP